MDEKLRKMFLQVTHENEQDRAECRAWWNDTAAEDKIRVWERIQVHHDDPIDEIVSRFAQLAFSEMFERCEIAGDKD